MLKKFLGPPLPSCVTTDLVVHFVFVLGLLTTLCVKSSTCAIVKYLRINRYANFRMKF